MDITNVRIDNGNPFDFGKTSADYAKYRDIYPVEFYKKIIALGLCKEKQSVLDIGTGTGVLPRNMYRFGAKWTGTDISEIQIKQAKILSEGLDIEYYVMPAENLNFPDNSFDVITACQCFWYLEHKQTAPLFMKLLKPGGYIAALCMEWLPFEDKVAGESEKLVLKYNPEWSGAGETVHPIAVPNCYYDYFELMHHEEYYLNVPFTRNSWNGRMKSCRGIGASLSAEKIEMWEQEHLKMLSDIAPECFDVLHYAAVAVLQKK